MARINLAKATHELTAELQLVNEGDWVAHNHAASELLEELLALDPSMFRPAPDIGWLVEDCRVAVRDCLDAFANAEEWLRGWSPQMLTEKCEIPLERTSTFHQRMASRTAILADRMLALRLLEDTTSPNPIPAELGGNVDFSA